MILLSGGLLKLSFAKMSKSSFYPAFYLFILTRMKVWSARGYAERNKLFMEEWLTDFRSNLLKKCQTLMKQEYIVNVKTKDGDIIVFYNDKVDGLLKRRVVVTQEEYDDLLRAIGKSEEFDPSKDGLAKPSPTEPNKKLEDIAEEEKT